MLNELYRQQGRSRQDVTRVIAASHPDTRIVCAILIDRERGEMTPYILDEPLYVHPNTGVLLTNQN